MAPKKVAAPAVVTDPIAERRKSLLLARIALSCNRPLDTIETLKGIVDDAESLSIICQAFREIIRTFRKLILPQLSDQPGTEEKVIEVEFNQNLYCEWHSIALEAIRLVESFLANESIQKTNETVFFAEIEMTDFKRYLLGSMRALNFDVEEISRLVKDIQTSYDSVRSKLCVQGAPLLR